LSLAVLPSFEIIIEITEQIRDNRIMRVKHSLLSIPLILLFAISSCDSGGGNSCVELTGPNNFLLAFQGCPNDGIKQICNSFECVLTQQIGGAPLPPDALVVIDPSDCSRIDFCFNLDCDLRNDLGQVVGEVILTTEEILANNEFIGVSILNDRGPFDFSCTPVLPLN
jgi:hypothetical protein